jgi:poly-beta-1,6-N-acetyl-D-glucosamine synthase
MDMAVGIMAYNEGRNVAAALGSVLEQQGPHVRIGRVVVVASGCTDDTVARAREAAAGDPRVLVIEQPRREGKASAIALFLESVPDAGVLVLAGGDTRLEPGALEALLAPFDEPAVGMTGGRPVPVDDPTRLLGRVVHLLWELHHRAALRSPKLGELVAFRRTFGTLPRDTAVDEATIESLARSQGLRLEYAPDARVRMRGPGTVRDFLRQRRRIHAGHRHLRRTRRYTVSTFSLGAVLGAVRDARQAGTCGPGTLVAAAALEAAARALGAWDDLVTGRDHSVWEPVVTSKDLNR